MVMDVFLGSTPPRQRSAELFEQLRSAIVVGRLEPGARLPTSRDLAADVGVARSTVTTVYGRLIAEGYAEGRPGDGTFVTSFTAGDRGSSSPVGSVPAMPGRSAPTGDSARLPPAGGWKIDLRTGRPDPSLFPLVEWRRCVTTALQRPPPGYGHPAGQPELRRALAAWVGRSRGVQVAPESIVVTNGAQGAFDLCARLVCADGDVAVVENPGYQPAWRAFEQYGATVAPVPVDIDGIVVDHIPDQARLIYVTPSHQAPTGAVLSANRRRRLLDLAAARGALVVEDDYDTEYRYVDRPLEPLHRLDTDERVIYVGSFSKTLSPSLRLGFIAASIEVVDALTAIRSVTGTQPPHLTQAALAAFITGGGYERHLRRSRRIYLSRRDHLLARLAELAASGAVAGFAPCHAGLHTTIDLRPGTDPAEIVEQLRSRGIAIHSTTDLWHGTASPGLVIGFGLADTSQLDEAIAVIETLLGGRSRRRSSPDGDR